MIVQNLMLTKLFHMCESVSSVHCNHRIVSNKVSYESFDQYHSYFSLKTSEFPVLTCTLKIIL
jgi:hypothetical protein